MYHIRKDGIPISCDDNYRMAVLNALESRDLALMRQIPKCESDTEGQCLELINKFKDLFPDDLGAWSVEKGNDPYLATKGIVGTC